MLHMGCSLVDIVDCIAADWDIERDMIGLVVVEDTVDCSGAGDSLFLEVSHIPACHPETETAYSEAVVDSAPLAV